MLLSQVNIPFLKEISESHKVILASGSPRRKEILSRLGIPIIVKPSNFPETLIKSDFKDAKEYTLRTAEEKAFDVFKNERNINPEQSCLIIAADTIVIHEGRILEKPTSRSHAKEILETLSGSVHSVITAVVLLEFGVHSDNPRKRTFIEETRVEFGVIPPLILESYIDSDEPYDKAGAYGYQGFAAFFVKKIDGCFYNVVGFPAYRFFNELQAMFNTF